MPRFNSLLSRAMLPAALLLNAGCDQNVDQSQGRTAVVESATHDELQSMSQPVTKPKVTGAAGAGGPDPELSGTSKILLSLSDYKKGEFLPVFDNQKKTKELDKFTNRLKTLGIGLKKEGYKASTLKDLPKEEIKAIEDWLNTNQAWIILTRVDLELGEGIRRKPRDVDYKKFIEAQYFDFLYFTKFVSEVTNSDVDIDKASLDHAERTLELLDRELEKYPDFNRGLYRHEQFWVAVNAETLKEMGYETFIDPRTKYVDKSKLRNALVKFINSQNAKILV